MVSCSPVRCVGAAPAACWRRRLWSNSPEHTQMRAHFRCLSEVVCRVGFLLFGLYFSFPLVPAYPLCLSYSVSLSVFISCTYTHAYLFTLSPEILLQIPNRMIRLDLIFKFLKIALEEVLDQIIPNYRISKFHSTEVSSFICFIWELVGCHGPHSSGVFHRLDVCAPCSWKGRGRACVDLRAPVELLLLLPLLLGLLEGPLLQLFFFLTFQLFF